MLFLTRWFGVTGSDAERSLAREKSEIEEIVQKVLLLQAKAAAQQNRPLCRGTHAKGVCARAQFEVFDLTVGRDPGLAMRLAKGMFAEPGVYPAIVRFANADALVNSDFKADVRSLSFSVDLTRDGTSVQDSNVGRQDFSMQNTNTLPINDSTAFLALAKVFTASNPAAGLWSLPFKDKLRVLRSFALALRQSHQKIRAYQQLRYGSNVPFRHGPIDIVKYSATPSLDNAAKPLQKSNPNGLQDELIRHLREDSTMSTFDFGVQFLDVNRMTYWGKRRDASFWIENASIDWHETEAPFHTVARLTLLPNSQLPREESEATYFDVTGNSTPDSAPVGSINRARWHAEVASKKARMMIIGAVLALIAPIGFWFDINRTSEIQRATPAPGISASTSNASFAPSIENESFPPDIAPEGMVWIPGGEFSMGAQNSPDMNEVGMQATRDSRPIHRVYVDAFWMDKNDITNEEFARFVRCCSRYLVGTRGKGEVSTGHKPSRIPLRSGSQENG